MNDAPPESDAPVSLGAWLARPASWSWPQRLALLALLCAGAAALAAGVSALMADVLAVAAYGVLAVLVLLLFWQRFFSHD